MRRRQKFLSEKRYENFLEHYEHTFVFWQTHRFESDSPEQEQSLRARHFQQLYLKNFLIRYTAGTDVSSLSAPLETLIASYEQLQQALEQYEQIKHITPLIIDDWLDEYQECVQVISLCILLGRIDLLQRFVVLIDQAGYAGTDTLYEDLLIKVLPEREDIDQWYHDVCTPLIQAVYADERQQASEHLATYCKQWYPAFSQAPWHDSHLDGDDGSYVGYWAMEAAAIAYLYDIDDSHIEHIVYPKELVAYARRRNRAAAT